MILDLRSFTATLTTSLGTLTIQGLPGQRATLTYELPNGATATTVLPPAKLAAFLAAWTGAVAYGAERVAFDVSTKWTH